MLCAKCKEREATVHFTIVDGDKLQKTDFCVECAEPLIQTEEGFELMELFESMKSEAPGVMGEEVAFEDVKSRVEAYEFVKEALNDTQERCGVRHVSGRELLQGLRELAIRKFGKRAKTVLAEWKIFRTEDFGEIVFEMIEAGLLTKRPGDSREEFRNGFDFYEAFPET